jgi:hypothetical protein
MIFLSLIYLLSNKKYKSHVTLGGIGFWTIVLTNNGSEKNFGGLSTKIFLSISFYSGIVNAGGVWRALERPWKKTRGRSGPSRAPEGLESKFQNKKK